MVRGLYLKSNMDRFIDTTNLQSMFCIIDLKSNMDRFIDECKYNNKGDVKKFKIQYG